MHARLTASERKQIEKDIATHAASLSEAISCGDQRIVQLEKLLEQHQKDLAAAVAKAAESADQAKELQSANTSLKDEVNARNADKSVLQLEVRTLNKDLDTLRGQLASSEGEVQSLSSKLADAIRDKEQAADASAGFESEISSLMVTISEYETTDSELRKHIAELEQLLIVERRKSGQELMARILELEAMLNAERQRVQDIPELSEITNIDSRLDAANSVTVTKTKQKLAKKMG